MHIGIIGNTNNYPFLLAVALREEGHLVRLVLLRSEALHRPDAGGLIDGPLPDWIFDAAPIGLEAFQRQSADIGPAISFASTGMDAVILNDVAPSLTNLIPLPAISLLTGSDLTYSANPGTAAIRRRHWSIDYATSIAGRLASDEWERFVLRQRDGIRASRKVSFPWSGLLPDSDAVIDGIGLRDDQRIFLYFTDVDAIAASPIPELGRLKILNGARLNWVQPMPADFSRQDHKGADVLLHGLRKFLDDGGDAELTLIEKGMHIAETRELVDELGLNTHIVWLPEVPLSQFQALIARSHIVCDQFGQSIPGMVGLTAMAMGRAVLSNFPSPLTVAYSEPWPVCQAATADDVAMWLAHLHRSPERLRQIGSDARQFAEQHLSARSAAETVVDVLADQQKIELATQLDATRDLARRLEEGRLDLLRQLGEQNDLIVRLQDVQDDHLGQISRLQAAYDASQETCERLRRESARYEREVEKLIAERRNP